jgi:hypothetical protein
MQINIETILLAMITTNLLAFILQSFFIYYILNKSFEHTAILYTHHYELRHLDPNFPENIEEIIPNNHSES